MFSDSYEVALATSHLPSDPSAAGANLTQALAFIEGRLHDAVAGSDLVAAAVLRDAASKPVKQLVQIDGHRPTGYDSVVRPDDDGDCLMSSSTRELSRSLGLDMPVRVLVHPGAQKADVVRLLDKIRAWVDRDGIEASRGSR